MSSNFILYPQKHTSTIQLLMVEKYSFSAPQAIGSSVSWAEGRAGVGELQCESWPTCFATNRLISHL